MSRGDFKPFQNLYQPLKGNMALWNTLDRIHDKLQDLTNQSTGVTTELSGTAAFTKISYNLTANTIISVPVSGDFLFVLITANGFQATFDPAVFASPIVGLSINNRNWILFVSFQGFWYQMVPVTNK